MAYFDMFPLTFITDTNQIVNLILMTQIYLQGLK